MKGYTVFNVEQIEGLPEVYYTRPEPKFSSVERIAHADRGCVGFCVNVLR
jgi:antirestriction protein ArdC